MTDLRYESLHNHTTTSDGLISYFQSLKAAEENHTRVIAFTDHDALPDERTLSELKAYEGPVKWLTGVELSSGLPKELGGHLAGTFHIVGLFVDPTNTPLLQHCQKAGIARLERMRDIVANLRKIGITISEADCLKASGGESVGRPHIVAAILMHPENVPVIEKLAEQMKLEAEGDPELAKTYQDMIVMPIEQWIYRMLISGEAFIPDIYVDYTYWTDMDTTVSLIRDAGGVAVIAHWFTVAKNLKSDLLGEILRDNRLDGVELANLNHANRSEAAAESAELAALAKAYGRLQTIGTDAHTAEDYKFFVTDRKEMAEQSIGQTARLLEKYKLDTHWSNLSSK